MPTEFGATAQKRKPHRFQSGLRAFAEGKFIFVGSDKFFIKGVTYGAFRPDDGGVSFTTKRKFAVTLR